VSTTERVLNLGSGFKPIAGAVNVDSVSDCEPEVIHDLEKFPWPFETDSFDRIEAEDILEHLHDTVRTMEEIHRICAPGGVVHITTPHFTCSNAYEDPTHCHQFGYFTFDHFTGDAVHGHYTRCRFTYRSRQLVFLPQLKNWAIRRIANRRPRFYERHLCWVFPAWFLALELEPVKGVSG
jgi:SAM-dependent methyltransferase